MGSLRSRVQGLRLRGFRVYKAEGLDGFMGFRGIEKWFRLCSGVLLFFFYKVL